MSKKSIVLITTLFLLFSCKSDSWEYPVGANRTVIAYILGENSLSRFVQEDVDEMLEGLESVSNEEDCNFLVYLSNYEYKNQLYRLVKDKKGVASLELVKDFGNQNSINPEVMREVLHLGFSSYPAEKYGLILWSHADGWIPAPTTRWFGEVGHNGPKMDILDLKKGLASAPHFEFILFDACFMQSVEVLYELKAQADYFIGSPTEIPGPGAPYQKVLPELYKKGNPALGVAKAYYQYYADKYHPTQNSNSSWRAGASISVVKSAKLESLALATAHFFKENIALNEEIPLDGIMYYDRRKIGQRYYFDLDGLVESRLGGESAAYMSWKKAYDEAVVFYGTTPTNYTIYLPGRFSTKGSMGLSVYIPRSYLQDKTDFYHRFGWYSVGGWKYVGW